MSNNISYYDRSEALSYNALFNWINGMRSHGKTFNYKDWCINDFIKNGNMFVWLRRYKQESKNVKDSFFSDIIKENKYPNAELTVNGNNIFINKKQAGYILTLSMAQYYKSMQFPYVNKIIFDEYLITDSKISYLPNEVCTFLELYSTIARTRDNVRVIFIGNNVSVRNKYFQYFNIYPIKGKRFTYKNDMLIEMDSDLNFKEHVYKTRFGKIISGSEYGNYAVENEFLLDNDDYVEEKPISAKYQLTLAYDNQYYGVFYDIISGLMFITDKKNMNGGLAVAITKNDVKGDAIISKSQYIRDIINTIKEMFMLNKCRYESIKIKAGFNDLMKELYIK